MLSSSDFRGTLADFPDVAQSALGAFFRPLTGGSDAAQVPVSLISGANLVATLDVKDARTERIVQRLNLTGPVTVLGSLGGFTEQGGFKLELGAVLPTW